MQHMNTDLPDAKYVVIKNVNKDREVVIVVKHFHFNVCIGLKQGKNKCSYAISFRTSVPVILTSAK